MTGPTSNQPGAAPAVDAELMPKRAAFIKWAAGRGLDVTEVRDAWGARRFLAPIIDGMWEGWFNAPVEAVVYPPDGTTSPFTVINLGSGSVKIGDSVHDGRLPGLWFGKDGLGMGVEETLNRHAAEGETLAVVTFANVEGLDVLMEVVQRIRRIKFPGAPINATANSLEQSPRLAGYIDRKDLVRLSNCRATIWPGTNEIDAVPVYLGAPPAPSTGPQFEEDPLDIVRTLLCTVDHYWSLPEEKRECYPSPTSELSPLMQAARRACVERGFTAGGLAVEAAAGTPP